MIIYNMTSTKHVRSYLVSFFCTFFFFSGIRAFSEVQLKYSSSSKNYSIQEALKVLHLLTKINNSQDHGNPSALRKAVITESELNSYIAFRIDTEREEVMKELRLRLLKNNRVEGKLFIDLEGKSIPKILKPQMTFYFMGELQVENGLVRFNIKKLFLEEQPVPVLLLDTVIFVAFKMGKLESSSINNWYELPYGIENIEVIQGQVIMYY